jgi:hypothetical protein
MLFNWMLPLFTDVTVSSVPEIEPANDPVCIYKLPDDDTIKSPFASVNIVEEFPM